MLFSFKLAGIFFTLNILNLWFTGNVSKSLATKGSSRPLCPVGYFTCSSGKCILAVGRCNGVRDCYDGSDEWRCPSELVWVSAAAKVSITCCYDVVCLLEMTTDNRVHHNLDYLALPQSLLNAGSNA